MARLYCVRLGGVATTAVCYGLVTVTVTVTGKSKVVRVTGIGHRRDLTTRWLAELGA